MRHGTAAVLVLIAPSFCPGLPASAQQTPAPPSAKAAGNHAPLPDGRLGLRQAPILLLGTEWRS